MEVKSLLKSDIIIVISRLCILKVRWINPNNHIHRLKLKLTLQDKSELVIRSKHISKQKSYSKKKKPVLYSSIHLCTRLAYLYHVTIECSVSRYYDMIWNHTAVATSLFTVFPCENLFHGHHCFSKYIADQRRICRAKFSSL
jgi:hypothetical protein